MRLATGFWVAAYRRRLEQEGIACYVARKGDDTSGAVIVKLATMDGKARLFERRSDPASGDSRWMLLAEGEEAAIDASARRQAGFDPDLWIVEVEDRQGRHLLDQEGLE